MCEHGPHQVSHFAFQPVTMLRLQKEKDEQRRT
jgi:hypothetical protein